MTNPTQTNRAKCLLCNDTIESFSQYDFVRCGCGEIAVDGGPTGMRALAKDWANFIRIDELGNEHKIKVIEKSEEATTGQQETQTEPQGEQASDTPKHWQDKKETARILLNEMIKNYEKLPHAAMHAACTNADLLSILYLLGALFKESGNMDIEPST